jgi:hypothetical protein
LTWAYFAWLLFSAHVLFFGLEENKFIKIYQEKKYKGLPQRR